MNGSGNTEIGLTKQQMMAAVGYGLSSSIRLTEQRAFYLVQKQESG